MHGVEYRNHLYRRRHGRRVCRGCYPCFSLDGVSYEIDLGSDSYDMLLEALAPFMKAGRKSGKIRRPVGRSGSTSDTAAIGAWAKSSGNRVNDHGRVPSNIREAYTKAAS
ncbi:Lsr2 family protein [Streptomyces netropsis]|uniref:Lsr2 family protein n=1 Tax=Streptomyces netropsis TaxID=55404 RepID=UPI00379F06C1